MAGKGNKEGGGLGCDGRDNVVNASLIEHGKSKDEFDVRDSIVKASLIENGNTNEVFYGKDSANKSCSPDINHNVISDIIQTEVKLLLDGESRILDKFAKEMTSLIREQLVKHVANAMMDALRLDEMKCRLTQMEQKIENVAESMNETLDCSIRNGLIKLELGENIGLQLDKNKKPTPPRRATVKRSIKRRGGSGAIRKDSRVAMDYYTIDDYDNHVGDGISFRKDNPVEVLERSSSGWWLVKINRQEGWVPASFIEKRPSKKAATGGDDSPFLNNNSVNGSENKPKMGGHAFQPYSKEMANPIPVKPTIPERPVQLGGVASPTGEETNEFSAARAKLKPAGQKVNKKQSNFDSGDELNEEVKRVFTRKASGPNAYITVTRFEKEDVEGIGFEEGVEVEVLEEHDSGWWLIRIGENEGWAPSSFLQKL